jgi:hypothetical protein
MNPSSETDASKVSFAMALLFVSGRLSRLTVRLHLSKCLINMHQVFAAWSDPAAKARWFADSEGWETLE